MLIVLLLLSLLIFCTTNHVRSSRLTSIVSVPAREDVADLPPQERGREYAMIDREPSATCDSRLPCTQTSIYFGLKVIPT